MPEKHDSSTIAKLEHALKSYELMQSTTLSLIASANYAAPSIRKFSGSSLTNITTEGYPGRRYHPGSSFADEIESLACRAARDVFACSYANVQPHSASSANLAALLSLLRPQDTIMGMELRSGGHLTHGSPASFSGSLFKSTPYNLKGEILDYDYVRECAIRYKPKLIICGASSYPRRISFSAFQQIASEIGALLLADISHISGLIIAELHESPAQYAHIFTTSTYKQLGGPRGGLLLSNFAQLEDSSSKIHSTQTLLNKAVFPGTQGTPDVAVMAAKAATLANACSPRFREKMHSTVNLATYLAEKLKEAGFKLVTGGTDTHMLLVDLSRWGLDGEEAEKRLESIGILANRNFIPHDPGGPQKPSGIRLGTNTLATRGFDNDGIDRFIEIFEVALTCNHESDLRKLKTKVETICSDYPIPVDEP